jgi:hypothetical protein
MHERRDPMDEQKFADEVPKVLLAFQYVEEALRQYILRANFMIASEVQPFVDYSPTDPAVDKASFGRLVSLFARFNSRSELHRSLKALVEKRNFYAHQAYLVVGGMADLHASIGSGVDSLEQTRVETKRCLHELFEETRQLEVRFVAHKKSGV